MKPIRLLGLILLLGISGCTTSVQLEDNTIHQGKSLTDIEYEMVLDNLAMFKTSPGALPWHAIISKGAITINDIANPAAGYKGGPPVRTVSLSGSRAWQGDWTFTPVVDPVALENLRKIYVTRSKQKWFHTGLTLPKRTGFSGHYGLEFVWVDKSGMKDLVETTMEVLSTASSVTTPSLAFTKDGPLDFAQRLNNSTNATNKDYPSQFLLAQLPPAVKNLLAVYSFTNPAPDNIYWLSNVLQSSLNKTIGGWTTNEAIQFAANIYNFSTNSLDPGFKKTLGDSFQTNNLLYAIGTQISNSYPNDFKVVFVTNSASAASYSLLPGGSQSIQSR